MIQFSKMISSFFYIGFFPIASGTFGSLVAFLLWWFFVPENLFYQLILILFVIIIGTISSGIIESNLKFKDPSFIVIDEVAGMFISLFLIPKSLLICIIGFFLFRFFDIYKPSLIDSVQKIPNGIGVMADDILAGIVTCFILNFIIFL
ncbi:MAG: phosphatidylglycerophosphatase A [Candidatus Marinimicrobia bacterium]|nr:phosphatidylglycerophosphatase A [Candidatus Neomarinimicrobiota bacterium]